MGFLDEIKGTVNKGIASAGRGTKSLSLKAQINELEKSQNEYFIALGKAFYGEEDVPQELRDRYENLFHMVGNIDNQIAGLRSELETLEQQANLTSSAGSAATARCSKCGKPVREDDAFCMECGAPIEYKPASPAAAQFAGVVCANCGAKLTEGAAFCMECGTPATVAEEETAPLPPAAEEPPAEEADGGLEPADAPEPEPAPAIPVCPSCGAEVNESAAFCRNCGTKL